MEAAEARRYLDAARVAVLGTVRPGGSPHLVPVTFAVVGDTIITAVDDKPKTTRRLQRLVNIEHNPSVSVLVHEYAGDWRTLWWVRVDGTATTLTAGSDFDAALSALAAKYPAYTLRTPAGPVVEIAIQRLTWWAAAAG